MKAVGQGFKVDQSMTSETGYRWSETWLITQSTAVAQRQQQALHQRLDNTEKHLQQLAAKAGETGQAFLQRAQTLIQSRKLTDLLTVELTQTSQLTKKYLGRGRPGPNRPYRFISQIDYHLTVTRNPKQIEQALTLCGWRIYITNYTPLTLTAATLYYRGQWTNERGYHRFKRVSLPALPLFLRIPERIKGLMFLLMIALQLLCLIEFVVQRNLAQQQTQVEGLVPGNPKIKTARPSAERILAQFEGIHLLIQDQALQRVEPLTPLQRFLLELMNTPEHIYHFL